MKIIPHVICTPRVRERVRDYLSKGNTEGGGIRIAYRAALTFY